MYKSVFEIFPKYLTAMYNGCLSRGFFPKRRKTAKMIAIVKPGKEKQGGGGKVDSSVIVDLEVEPKNWTHRADTAALSKLRIMNTKQCRSSQMGANQNKESGQGWPFLWELNYSHN